MVVDSQMYLGNVESIMCLEFNYFIKDTLPGINEIRLKNRYQYFVHFSHDNDDEESKKSCARRRLIKKERTHEQKCRAARSQANYYERKKSDPELVLKSYLLDILLPSTKFMLLCFGENWI